MLTSEARCRDNLLAALDRHRAAARLDLKSVRPLRTIGRRSPDKHDIHHFRTGTGMFCPESLYPSSYTSPVKVEQQEALRDLNKSHIEDVFRERIPSAPILDARRPGIRDC